MGWTTARGDDTRRYINHKFYYNGSSGSSSVVDIALKLHVAYVAIRKSYNVGPLSGARHHRWSGTDGVFAVVLEFERRPLYEEYAYQTCFEEEGPLHYDCPERILDKLSPLELMLDPSTAEFNYAREWREQCRARIAKRRSAPKPGSTIRFNYPIRFTDGRSHDTFVIQRENRKTAFVLPDDKWAKYKISRWKEREFSVLSS